MSHAQRNGWVAVEPCAPRTARGAPPARLGRAVLVTAALAILPLGASLTPAAAQVCAVSSNGSTPVTGSGASASQVGDGGFACGNFATAGAPDSTAVSLASSATGTGSTATGAAASAGGIVNSNAFTNQNTSAYGATASAGATAAGQTNATAIGEGASANAANATALGQGSTASGANASALGQGRKADAGAIPRVSAPDIERLVVDALGGLCPHQSGGPRSDDRGLIEQLDVRLTVRTTEITVDWRSSERLAPLEDEDVTDRQTLSIPYAPQPHRRRREIILPAHAESYVRPLRDSEHRHLLRAIAQGQAWLQEIFKGAGITPTAIAIREEQTERWVRKTLSLALLDPKLVRAAILGQLPRGFGAKRLSDLPSLWPDQWRALGLTRPA